MVNLLALTRFTATPPLPMFLLLALLLTSPGGSAGSAAAVASAAWKSSANVVTLSNGEARRDTDGKIVDSHSGNVVLLNGRFFLYGERYGKNIGMGKDQPKLSVYSSPTMESGSWEDHGDLDVVGNWSWPTKPHGTFFTPWAVVHPKTKRVVMWFNAYMNGCCDGNFGTASSDDGLHFTLHTLEETTSLPGAVDCNALLVDDDGTGYIAFTAEAPGPGLSNHRVAIEKLTPDFTGTTKKRMGPTPSFLFPHDYVEGPMLWKRKGKYYVSYGSCCCFCRAGSGNIVLSAPSINGPWTTQREDTNCVTDSAANTSVCGGYGAGNTPFGRPEVNGRMTINAQGIGLSVIPAAQPSGEPIYLWHGERWLSAANNPPGCPDECQPATGVCADAAAYTKGEQFMYWIPLEFDAMGAVKPFRPFVDNFSIPVPSQDPKGRRLFT